MADPRPCTAASWFNLILTRIAHSEAVILAPQDLHCIPSRLVRKSKLPKKKIDFWRLRSASCYDTRNSLK
jgi:hypothetical protein